MTTDSALGESRAHEVYRLLREGLVVAPVPSVPELVLLQADAALPIWERFTALVGAGGAELPFWAFPWAGGQALARFILDHPETVEGREVLDAAAGSGLVGVAAARAGAHAVICVDVDPVAGFAVVDNGAANAVELQAVTRDVFDLERVPQAGVVVLVGDVCYDAPMAARAIAWMRRCAAQGCDVLLGDPLRRYAPHDGLAELARIDVVAAAGLEASERVEVAVWRVLPAR